jgi:hypothetical protein
MNLIEHGFDVAVRAGSRREPWGLAQICCVFLPAFTQPKIPSGMMATLV